MSKIPPYDLIVEPLEALDRIEEWLRKKRVELEGPGDDAFARYQQGEDVDPHAPGFVESKAKFHARQAVGQVGQHVPGLKKFYPWNSDTTREMLTDRIGGLAGSWEVVAMESLTVAQHSHATNVAMALRALALAVDDSERLALVVEAARKVLRAHGESADAREVRSAEVRRFLSLFEEEIAEAKEIAKAFELDAKGKTPKYTLRDCMEARLRRMAGLLVDELIHGNGGVWAAEFSDPAFQNVPRIDNVPLARGAAVWQPLAKAIEEKFRKRCASDAYVNADAHVDAERYLADALEVLFKLSPSDARNTVKNAARRPMRGEVYRAPLGRYQSRLRFRRK